MIEGANGLLLQTLIAVFAVDQLAKGVVVSRLRGGGVALCGSAVRIRPVLNQRTGAGLLAPRLLAFLSVWLFVFVAVLRFDLPSYVFQSSAAQVALGAALGGAASNLFDLIVRKKIVDFIDLRVWPVFNLADLAIVSGVIGAFVAR